jgi:hypothetical protein
MTSLTYTAPPKDPADIVDYGWDCTAWLKEGETIAAQTVVSDSADLVLSAVSVVAGIVTWRASGGTLGATHKMTGTVTSSTGRRAQRTFLVPVMDL